MVAQTKPTLELAKAVALTGTAIGPAIACFQTPCGAGGAGRVGTILIDVPPGGAAVIKWQGHPGLASKAVPASGDAGWYDLVGTPWTNATSPLQIDVEIPAFIRYNITTLGTGALNARLYGVQ
jgi:hypothetical protein